MRNALGVISLLLIVCVPLYMLLSSPDDEQAVQSTIATDSSQEPGQSVPEASTSTPTATPVNPEVPPTDVTGTTGSGQTESTAQPNQLTAIQRQQLFERVAAFEQDLFTYGPDLTDEQFYDRMAEYAFEDYASMLRAGFLSARSTNVARSQTGATADDVAIIDSIIQDGELAVHVSTTVNVEQVGTEGQLIIADIETHESVWVFRDGVWLAAVPIFE